jgi:hypothetical protein
VGWRFATTIGPVLFWLCSPGFAGQNANARRTGREFGMQVHISAKNDGAPSLTTMKSRVINYERDERNYAEQNNRKNNCERPENPRR